MIENINENGLTPNEENEIIAKLKQKIVEMHNPNLDENNEQKIVLFAELFRLCLTNEGERLLRWRIASIERLRNMILKRINEYAVLNVARVNEEYMAAATNLQDLLEEISNNA
jgi:hypothetical protein